MLKVYRRQQTQDNDNGRHDSLDQEKMQGNDNGRHDSLDQEKTQGRRPGLEITGCKDAKCV
jgi:hypothetical protein